MCKYEQKLKDFKKAAKEHVSEEVYLSILNRYVELQEAGVTDDREGDKQ